ncbi:MAG: hypothetical protein ACJ73D_08605 [Pyrinomonadaceae bacterium]
MSFSLRISRLLLGISLLSVGIAPCLGQASTNKRRNSQKGGTDATVADGPGDYFPPDEIQSRSRYVVINDDLRSDDGENGKAAVPVARHVDVLIDRRAYTRDNLTYLFNYLASYYAQPQWLMIEVHTSLMTLETLEERIAMTTHSKRDNFRPWYETASYNRFDDGAEVFSYDIGKPGRLVTKTVVLRKKSR